MLAGVNQSTVDAEGARLNVGRLNGGINSLQIHTI
jgi:hypothetical protein